MKTINNRIVWVDYLKVLCMTMMVLSHTGAGKGFIIQVIHLFYMQGLFFISGYLYHRRNLLKLWHSFILPIISYTLLNFTVRTIIMLFKHKDPAIIERLSLMWQPLFVSNRGDYIYPIVGIWFLIVLICIRLLAGDIKWLYGYSQKFTWQLLIVLLTLLAIMGESRLTALGYYHAFKVVLCFPYFLSGFLFLRYKDNLINIPNSMIFILGVASLALAYGQKDINNYWGTFSLGYVVAFFSFIVSTCFLINIFNRYGKPCKFITTLSNGTILILGIHYFLIQCLSHLPAFYAKKYIITVLIIIISYLLIRLVEKKKWSFLIGK